MRRSHVTVTAVALFTVVLLAGCGGGDDSVPVPSGSGSASGVPLLGESGEPIAVITEDPQASATEGAPAAAADGANLYWTRAVSIGDNNDYFGINEDIQPGEQAYAEISLPENSKLEKVKWVATPLLGGKTPEPPSIVMVDMPSGQKCNASLIESTPEKDRVVEGTGEQVTGTRAPSGTRVCVFLTLSDSPIYAGVTNEYTFLWSQPKATDPNDWLQISFGITGHNLLGN